MVYTEYKDYIIKLLFCWYPYVWNHLIPPMRKPVLQTI